ncbi:MAG: NAD-binding protein [bacterium]
MNGVPVELPGGETGPLGRIGRRMLFALGLIVFVALVTYVGRDGYVDPEDARISLLDAFYYSTVTITTTGYGDILPVSEQARLATTLLVTPARILFLILLVGTTLEILAERTRFAYRLRRWRRNLNDHTIICGYGTKGKSAIRTLLAQGADPKRIAVIEKRADARAEATAAGFTVVVGDSAEKHVLDQAGIRDARAVIVAVDRDDAAVLVTLTARELAPRATIVAAVREEENLHLLHQSGADSVITSSEAAGRLLGIATETPETVEVLEDLLSFGTGLDIVQHEIGPGAGGPLADARVAGPILAVVRDGELLRFDNERAAQLQPGDRVVAVRSHAESTVKGDRTLLSSK